MPVTVNFWGVLLAAAASFAVGFAWYSPVLFGKAWLKLSGRAEEEIKKGNPALAMTVSFATDLIMAYILAYFLYYAARFDGQFSPLESAGTAIQAWLGFVATVMLSDSMFNRKPFFLFLINAGYRLASLAAMGLVLYAFIAT